MGAAAGAPALRRRLGIEADRTADGVLERACSEPAFNAAGLRAAAQALARIGTRPAIDALIAALEKSPRSPADDYLAEAVLLLKDSYLQAYLQEQFDRATSPNVRYALGRALAGTVPPRPDAPEEPQTSGGGTEPAAGEGSAADEADSPWIPSGAVPPAGVAAPAGVD